MHKLNVHNLVKRLNELCDKLDSKYYVNFGGCCYLASVIAYHLDKLGIEYRLVIYSNELKNPLYINHEVYSKIKNFRSELNSVSGYNNCNHYTLYIKGAGIINPGHGRHKYYVDGITASNIKWIYRVSSWNTDYNRRDNRKIRNIINSFFLAK